MYQTTNILAKSLWIRHLLILQCTNALVGKKLSWNSHQEATPWWVDKIHAKPPDLRSFRKGQRTQRKIWISQGRKRVSLVFQQRNLTLTQFRKP